MKQVRHDVQLHRQMSEAADHTEKALSALEQAVETIGLWRGVNDDELELMGTIRRIHRNFGNYALATTLLNIVTAAKEPKENA